MNGNSRDASVFESVKADIEQIVGDLPLHIQTMKGMVDRVIAGGDCSFAPQLLVACLRLNQGPEMQVFYIAQPFNSVVEKRGAMVRIGRRLHQERRLPIVAVFASEAWTASYNPKRPRPWILPEEAPDRREVIQVAGLAVGTGPAAFTTLPIGRDPNNRLVPAGA